MQISFQTAFHHAKIQIVCETHVYHSNTCKHIGKSRSTPLQIKKWKLHCWFHFIFLSLLTLMFNYKGLSRVLVSVSVNYDSNICTRYKKVGPRSTTFGFSSCFLILLILVWTPYQANVTVTARYQHTTLTYQVEHIQIRTPASVWASICSYFSDRTTMTFETAFTLIF